MIFACECTRAECRLYFPPPPKALFACKLETRMALEKLQTEKRPRPLVLCLYKPKHPKLPECWLFLDDDRKLRFPAFLPARGFRVYLKLP